MAKVASFETEIGKVSPAVKQEPVSVSLQFWHSGSQCLSVWNQSELKKLRKTIDKIQTLTAAGIRTDAGLQFKMHSGPPIGSGFGRTSSMPKDFSLCEVRVDLKSRLHGVLASNVFFLVWLDRGHDVFPSGK